MHQYIRRAFDSKLQTETDDDGIITITAASTQAGWHANRARAPVRRAHDGQQRPARIDWDDLGGPHLHFSLYKENKDTMEVIHRLSRALRVNIRTLQFAGTKDRRAVTTQRVSVFKVRAEKLASCNSDLRGAKVGDFEYKRQGLVLGELAGNEFVITLRDCKVLDVSGNAVENLCSETTMQALNTVISLGVRRLQEQGFINYFGLQRFGSFSTRTDTIGLKMLQGDMQGAVDEILAYSEDLLSENRDTSRDRIAADDRARAEAIHLFRTTGAAAEALSILPHKYSGEANIIQHLGHASEQRRGDHQGALNCIPKNLRSMYGHAYQSLVWNVMAGQRWKLYGGQVVEGDLVLVNEHEDKQISSAELAEPLKEEVDEGGEPIVLPSAEDGAGAHAQEDYERARALTQEEANSGKYTIYDIVLPTPGYDVLYPSNAMADHYRTFMASERGGRLDPHNMRRQWKAINMSGSYRKFIARPLGEDPMKFEVRAYTKNDEQMVETDLEKLQKPGKIWKAKFDELEESFAAEDRGVEKVDKDKELPPHVDNDSDKKIAAIIRFQLGTSQYATMALRELMGPTGVIAFKPDFSGGR